MMTFQSNIMQHSSGSVAFSFSNKSPISPIVDYQKNSETFDLLTSIFNNRNNPELTKKLLAEARQKIPIGTNSGCAKDSTDNNASHLSRLGTSFRFPQTLPVTSKTSILRKHSRSGSSTGYSSPPSYSSRCPSPVDAYSQSSPFSSCSAQSTDSGFFATNFSEQNDALYSTSNSNNIYSKTNKTTLKSSDSITENKLAASPPDVVKPFNTAPPVNELDFDINDLMHCPKSSPQSAPINEVNFNQQKQNIDADDKFWSDLFNNDILTEQNVSDKIYTNGSDILSESCVQSKDASIPKSDSVNEVSTVDLVSEINTLMNFEPKKSQPSDSTKHSQPKDMHETKSDYILKDLFEDKTKFNPSLHESVKDTFNSASTATSRLLQETSMARSDGRRTSLEANDMHSSSLLLSPSRCKVAPPAACGRRQLGSYTFSTDNADTKGESCVEKNVSCQGIKTNNRTESKLSPVNEEQMKGQIANVKSDLSKVENSNLKNKPEGELENIADSCDRGSLSKDAILNMMCSRRKRGNAGLLRKFHQPKNDMKAKTLGLGKSSSMTIKEEHNSYQTASLLHKTQSTGTEVTIIDKRGSHDSGKIMSREAVIVPAEQKEEHLFEDNWLSKLQLSADSQEDASGEQMQDSQPSSKRKTDTAGNSPTPGDTLESITDVNSVETNVVEGPLNVQETNSAVTFNDVTSAMKKDVVGKDYIQQESKMFSENIQSNLAGINLDKVFKKVNRSPKKGATGRTKRMVEITTPVRRSKRIKCHKYVNVDNCSYANESLVEKINKGVTVSHSRNKTASIQAGPKNNKTARFKSHYSSAIDLSIDLNNAHMVADYNIKTEKDIFVQHTANPYADYKSPEVSKVFKENIPKSEYPEYVNIHSNCSLSQPNRDELTKFDFVLPPGYAIVRIEAVSQIVPSLNVKTVPRASGVPQYSTHDVNAFNGQNNINKFDNEANNEAYYYNDQVLNHQYTPFTEQNFYKENSTLEYKNNEYHATFPPQYNNLENSIKQDFTPTTCHEINSHINTAEEYLPIKNETPRPQKKVNIRRNNIKCSNSRVSKSVLPKIKRNVKPPVRSVRSVWDDPAPLSSSSDERPPQTNAHPTRFIMDDEEPMFAITIDEHDNVTLLDDDIGVPPRYSQIKSEPLDSSYSTSVKAGTILSRTGPSLPASSLRHL